MLAGRCCLSEIKKNGFNKASATIKVNRGKVNFRYKLAKIQGQIITQINLVAIGIL